MLFRKKSDHVHTLFLSFIVFLIQCSALLWFVYLKSFSFLPLPLEHFSCFSHNPAMPFISCICLTEYACLLKELWPEIKLRVRQRLRLVLGPSCEDEGEGRTGLGHSLLCHYCMSITVFVNVFPYCVRLSRRMFSA